MTTFEMIIIAVGLAMDASAVSLAAAAAGFAANARAKFRLAFHFGLFQFLMPVLAGFWALALFPILKPMITGLPFFSWPLSTSG